MPISRSLLATAVFALAASVSTAEAFPALNQGSSAGSSVLTPVMDGCGPFGHRNPFGECRPNRGPRFYGNRFYGDRFDGEPGYRQRRFFNEERDGRGFREGEFDRGFRRDRFRGDDES